MKKISEMTGGPHSLASKYGVQIKENNSLGSMGINPNVNIEDEYIENLLKQVHFMNMQIKLLKEKQKQSGDNALWGVINRTNQPLVTNIVQSSEKYQQMKQNIDHTVHTLEKDITYLANDQGALLRQITFLQNRQTELGQRRSCIKSQYGQKNERMGEKVKEEREKLAQVLEQKSKQLNRQKELQQEYADLLNQDLKEKEKKEHDNLQIKNDEIIQQMMEKDKENEIHELQDSIKKLRDLFEQNVEYQRAKDEQQILKNKIGKIDKEVIGANFQIMQLNESIKMAERERDKEIRERKQITEDYENTKTMLQQILFMNIGRKEKEALARKKGSSQIQRAEEQSQKMQKNLNEIKRKLLKSEETHKNLKNEVNGLLREVGGLKEKRQMLIKRYESISKANQNEEGELIKVRTEIRQLDDEYEKISHQDVNMCLQLFELERELQYLRGRKQLLIETINLKDTLNELKVQDLQKVVQKNNDLNATVSDLMKKWEEIKTFSRI